LDHKHFTSPSECACKNVNIYQRLKASNYGPGKGRQDVHYSSSSKPALGYWFYYCRLALFLLVVASPHAAVDSQAGRDAMHLN
jgi:hypothetical protein